MVWILYVAKLQIINKANCVQSGGGRESANCLSGVCAVQDTTSSWSACFWCQRFHLLPVWVQGKEHQKEEGRHHGVRGWRQGDPEEEAEGKTFVVVVCDLSFGGRKCSFMTAACLCRRGKSGPGTRTRWWSCKIPYTGRSRRSFSDMDVWALKGHFLA